jgi:hypothetical protein
LGGFLEGDLETGIVVTIVGGALCPQIRLPTLGKRSEIRDVGLDFWSSLLFGEIETHEEPREMSAMCRGRQNTLEARIIEH